MDYDAILKKMSLSYFNGQLYSVQEQTPKQPEPPKLTKEQYIQFLQQKMNEKKRIRQEQFNKRKLLLTNISTSTPTHFNLFKLN